MQIPFTNQNITCPFCFNSFLPQEVVFRCEWPNCSGSAPDTIFATERGVIAQNMGHIILPPQPKKRFGLVAEIPRVADCDVCKRQSRAQLCPRCHYRFPPGMGLNQQRMIAIIGGSTTGKSNYIATLIKRMEDIGVNFKLIVHRADDDTIRRWEQEFYAPLFLRGKVLAATQSAQLDSRVKAPLIFRFTFTGGMFRQALNISFFDTAGEDMQSLTRMDIQTRYICQADAIIFLLDPLQIEKVRNQLVQHDPQTLLPTVDSGVSPVNIVSRLINLFEANKELRGTQKINVPIAFTLSKIDALRPLVMNNASSGLFRPGNHYGHVDMLDVQSLSTEISNYLKDWIGPGFCQLVEDRFPRSKYFGVSSLGSQPDRNGNLTGPVAPFRVEDPLLWVLYQLKLVEGW